MNQAHSPDFEALVSEAVLDFLRGRAAPRQEARVAAVRIPLRVGSDADLAALVQWLRRLCASDALRQQFVDGTLDLDIRLAAAEAAPPAVPAVAASPGGAPAAAPQACEEPVITEAALRRLGLRGRVLQVRAAAVITPSARDYARSAGLRIEKGDKP